MLPCVLLLHLPGLRGEGKKTLHLMLFLNIPPCLATFRTDPFWVSTIGPKPRLHGVLSFKFQVVLVSGREGKEKCMWFPLSSDALGFEYIILGSGYTVVRSKTQSGRNE